MFVTLGSRGLMGAAAAKKKKLFNWIGTGKSKAISQGWYWIPVKWEVCIDTQPIESLSPLALYKHPTAVFEFFDNENEQVPS